MNPENTHSEHVHGDPQSCGGGFDSDLTELELLRGEIEILQFELADRDRQIAESAAPTTDDGNEDTVELEQLVGLFEARMKDMAGELECSENRIRTLNDLLQATEEANLAERDERQHMEKWLTEIEGRLGESDQALKLELEQLKSREQRKDDLLRRAEEQIRKMMTEAAELAQNGQQDQQQGQKVLELNARVEQLQRENEGLVSEINELKEHNASSTADSVQLRQLQQQIAQMEMEAAQERAEISRERVELKAAQDEMMALKRELNRSNEADNRIRAMREHLREIQQDEERRKAERPGSTGIGSRISKLLGKV